MQGSADIFNPPSFAQHLFREAPAPKYLLWMPGADHLEPFVGSDPLEAIVRAISTEFLDRYVFLPVLEKPGNYRAGSRFQGEFQPPRRRHPRPASTRR